jgi:hypothetical protein
VRISRRVVFGTLEAVQQVLTACGWQINTAFIERVNLSIRQHVAAVGRRVTTLCKGEDGMRQQLVLYHVYYNFCPLFSVGQPPSSPNACWPTPGGRRCLGQGPPLARWGRPVAGSGRQGGRSKQWKRSFEFPMLF